jgi:ferredoxin-nitrite reductase
MVPLSESELFEVEPSASMVCPGLFYAVSAQDGVITRIRIPGGQISSEQSRILATLAEQAGDGWLQVTNRANFQIRATDGKISAAALSQLQASGLAAAASVDHLRNLMASPTAGIDSEAIYDTRPLVKALNHYISEHPELAGLSAKFSVGIDGGETVSIRDRPNDIKLVANRRETGKESLKEQGFRLYLNSAKGTDFDTGILLHPQDCVLAIGAVAQVYLAQADLAQAQQSGTRKKPRLRKLIQRFGIDQYLEAVHQIGSRVGSSQAQPEQASLNQAEPMSVLNYRHIGVHPQQQTGYSYLGVVLPLGWLGAAQLRALANLADRYGSGELRLTPWQNLLLPDIADQQIELLQNQIAEIGLSTSVNHPYTGLVACTGSTGCAASATDTRRDAIRLAAQLEQFPLDYPINIHVTGCPKSCAQHYSSDITLLGTVIEQAGESLEAYDIYVGAEGQPFGQLLYQTIASAKIASLIEPMVAVYQKYRTGEVESFREFIQRYSLQELRNLFETAETNLETTN